MFEFPVQRCVFFGGSSSSSCSNRNRKMNSGTSERGTNQFQSSNDQMDSYQRACWFGFWVWVGRMVPHPPRVMRSIAPTHGPQNRSPKHNGFVIPIVLSFYMERLVLITRRPLAGKSSASVKDRTWGRTLRAYRVRGLQRLRRADERRPYKTSRQAIGPEAWVRLPRTNLCPWVFICGIVE